jgi:hypothetical protein
MPAPPVVGIEISASFIAVLGKAILYQFLLGLVIGSASYGH